MTVEIGFYHCTRRPAAQVAAKLAAKVLESGNRLLIVGAPERLQALDRSLWTDDPDSFLPHAMAGGAHDDEQPILLSEIPVVANGASHLMLLEHGLPADLLPYARVLDLFDDGSEAHARARLDWKALQGRDGVALTYWKQTAGGGWEKQA